MKVKLLLMSIVCLILGSRQSGEIVNAVEKAPETEGNVGFIPGDEAIDIVDPNKPGNSVIPIDSINPENIERPIISGPLSLVYSSNLTFSKRKITTDDKLYYAEMQQVTESSNSLKQYKTSNFVQVTDLRGSFSGWSLTVKQNDQFKTLAGSELRGAELQFNNASTNTASSSPAPTVLETITMIPDNGGVESRILTASEGQGAGTHVIRFGSNDGTSDENSSMAKGVQLAVPGSTQKQSKVYTTTLTWILSDVPGRQ